MHDQYCEECGGLMCFEERHPDDRKDDEECGIPPRQMVCTKCWTYQPVEDD